MCFYYVALWSNYLSHDFQKFSSAYMKCLKLFFSLFTNVAVSLLCSWSYVCPLVVL